MFKSNHGFRDRSLDPTLSRSRRALAKRIVSGKWSSRLAARVEIRTVALTRWSESRRRAAVSFRIRATSARRASVGREARYLRQRSHGGDDVQLSAKCPLGGYEVDATLVHARSLFSNRVRPWAKRLIIALPPSAHEKDDGKAAGRSVPRLVPCRRICASCEKKGQKGRWWLEWAEVTALEI